MINAREVGDGRKTGIFLTHRLNAKNDFIYTSNTIIFFFIIAFIVSKIKYRVYYYFNSIPRFDQLNSIFMRTRNFLPFVLIIFNISNQKLTFPLVVILPLLLIGLIATGATQFDRPSRRAEHHSPNLWVVITASLVSAEKHVQRV